ncbi:hypothetical protein V493_00620 [Pseudogymnoascus sp. VKM F-4281 (FW-2241)]|nr:hypothetical protein V493_00620 [Pseudogymnoascus sp. VKM F-4281 (FW-2241)]
MDSANVLTPPICINGQPCSNKHLWFISGPAGCGKSTIANHIASSLNIPFLEGDDYHSQENVEKMRTGTPLTDSDRWDWLCFLLKASIEAFSMPATTLPFAPSHSVVVTCSALKRKYRDVMRVAPYYDPSIKVHFIYLDADEDMLLQRVTRRKDHYMGMDMVKSQLESLEVPGPKEADVSTVQAKLMKDQVEQRVLELVKAEMASEAKLA